MKKLTHNPKKSVFLLIITFIIALIMHNVIYATTSVEEPFFFTIAIVSALSVPGLIIYLVVIKLTSDNNS